MDIFEFGFGVGATLIVQMLWSCWRAPRVKVDGDGNWHFPIATLEQILAIPAERRERFLAEFPSSLRHIWALKDKYPLASAPGSTWVDDAKGEFRPVVVNAPRGTEDAFRVRPLSEEPTA